MYLTFSYSHQSKSYRSRINDVSILLEQMSVPADAGDKIEGEIMLVRALYPRLPNGMLDFEAGPYRYMAAFVTDNDVLIEHGGFETAGSSCSTLATATYNGHKISLSPGRFINGGHYIADNVNAAHYGQENARPKQPLIPGRAYVSRDRLAGTHVVRITGVPDLTSTLEYLRDNDLRVQQWEAAHALWKRECEAKSAQE